MEIGVSTEGAGKLSGTVTSNRESSWYRQKYSSVSHRYFLLEMVSGCQEQISERLKIPTLSSHVEF